MKIKRKQVIKNKNSQSSKIKDLISLVKPGDIMSYSGHTQTIYDIERDKKNNIYNPNRIKNITNLRLSYYNTFPRSYKLTYHKNIKHIDCIQCTKNETL